MPAKQARGRVSSSANQISPPSALLNSLKELNGTTQRFSAPSHLVQCLLFTLRMLVVPESGSIRSSSLKSTGWPQFCCSLLRRLHQRTLRRRHAQRAVASSRPLGSVAHDRGPVVRKHARHWREVS